MNKLIEGVNNSLFNNQNTIFVTARGVGKTTAAVNGAHSLALFRKVSIVLFFPTRNMVYTILREFTTKSWVNMVNLNKCTIHYRNNSVISIKSIQERLEDTRNIGTRETHTHAIYDDPAIDDESLEYWVRNLKSSTTILGTHCGKFKEGQKSKTFFYKLYKWGQEPLITNWSSKRYGYKDLVANPNERYLDTIKYQLGQNFYDTQMEGLFIDN